MYVLREEEVSADATPTYVRQCRVQLEVQAFDWVHPITRFPSEVLPSLGADVLDLLVLDAHEVEV